MAFPWAVGENCENLKNLRLEAFLGEGWGAWGGFLAMTPCYGQMTGCRNTFGGWKKMPRRSKHGQLSWQVVR